MQGFLRFPVKLSRNVETSIYADIHLIVIFNLDMLMNKNYTTPIQFIALISNLREILVLVK